MLHRSVYSQNMSILDERVSDFPRTHSIPFRMSRFENLSEFLKTATKSKKSMGKGTTGLTGMRFQDMPCMVLMLLLCEFYFDANTFPVTQ